MKIETIAKQEEEEEETQRVAQVVTRMSRKLRHSEFKTWLPLGTRMQGRNLLSIP